MLFYLPKPLNPPFFWTRYSDPSLLLNAVWGVDNPNLEKMRGRLKTLETLSNDLINYGSSNLSSIS